MPDKKVLIIGVGNILLGDEGFGPHLVDELEKDTLPEGVDLLDAGVATLDLASLVNGYRKLIILDTIRAGGRAGDLYKFRPEDIKQKKTIGLSLHQGTLLEAIDMMKLTGDVPEDIVIFAVEPENIKMKIGLSKKIRDKISEIKRCILNEVTSYGAERT